MLIKVKVTPGAKKREIVKKSDDSFQVWVKEKPRGGAANQETIDILKDYFKNQKHDFRLAKGRKSRNKIFEIK